MEQTRWELLQTLFHDTADKPANERLAYLTTAAGDDRQLIDEVLAMLEEDASSTLLLDQDVGQVAGRLLARPDRPEFQHDFGPYQLRELLGEGGMGVVYLAERADLGSVAAIKILRDAWMSPARREHFAREQRTLAQLNHPSIARLYDADTLPDGTPWFAMEYVDGVPLTQFCRDHTNTVSERLRLFRAVCEAVDYAHRRAVLHRDLKPSNILVKPDGSVRLLDFGIAKQLDPDADAHLHTRTALRFMTPAYAAPEQIRGQSAGIQTDVYSLGVILYELLAGRPAFDPADRSAGELERMILEREPERPSLAHRGTLRAGKSQWADLDVLCGAAMHKDPERRYRSVEALIRDLDHYFKGEPLESRPDTLAYRTAKFVRRNSRAVIASTVALLAVATLVVFFVVRLASARNTALLQAERTRRIQGFMFNLFDGGDKDAGPAEDLRVVALVDRGLAEAQSLRAEPAVQAELYQTLGALYQNLGKFPQADNLLQLALDQRAALLGRRTPGVSGVDVAESRIALGLLRVDQARLDQAEQFVHQGVDTIQHDLPASDPAVLKAATAYGKVLEVRGEYAKAIAFMEQAINSRSASAPNSPEFADALNELASNHFYAGHYDVCGAMFQRALDMHRGFYGDGHPKVAEDLINLGATRMEHGLYQDSERYDREAVAIDEKYYGPDHPQTASALTQLGRALYYGKHADEAAGLLRRALAIQERVHGPVHPAVASALNELGSIATVSGHYADAEADFQRMVDIYRAVYHDHHYLIGTAESNLATVYTNEKQYARAEALYREAIGRFGDTLPPNHSSIGIARIKLGHVLLLENRAGDAEPELSAGYAILKPKMSATASWLVSARKDLRAIYTAQGQPQRAAEFADPPATAATAH
jgi:serine/threonine-protein kinase